MWTRARGSGSPGSSSEPAPPLPPTYPRLRSLSSCSGERVAPRAVSPPGAILPSAACSAARMRSTRPGSWAARFRSSPGSAFKSNSSVSEPCTSFQSSLTQPRRLDQRQVRRPKRLSTYRGSALTCFPTRAGRRSRPGSPEGESMPSRPRSVGRTSTAPTRVEIATPTGMPGPARKKGMRRVDS